MELIKAFPEDYARFKKWAKELGLEENESSATVWLENFDERGHSGFTAFFASRVGSAEGITLISADAYGCVAVPQQKPWDMTGRDKTLTKEEADRILRKWADFMTDDDYAIADLEIYSEFDLGVYFGGTMDIRPLKMIREFPVDYDAFQGWIKERGWEETEKSAMQWLDSDAGFHGFEQYFADKVSKAEGITLVNDDGCVVFPNKFPWELTERERGLTWEDAEGIFREWAGKVTDDNLNISEYERL